MGPFCDNEKCERNLTHVENHVKELFFADPVEQKSNILLLDEPEKKGKMVRRYALFDAERNVGFKFCDSCASAIAMVTRFKRDKANPLQ